MGRMASMSALLFFSPIMPMPGGNRLAMRSGIFLEAYARQFELKLLVPSLADRPRQGPPPAFIERHAQYCKILPLDEALRPLLFLFAGCREPGPQRAALLQHPQPRQCPYDYAAARRLIQDRLIRTDHHPLALAGGKAQHQHLAHELPDPLAQEVDHGGDLAAEAMFEAVTLDDLGRAAERVISLLSWT